MKPLELAEVVTQHLSKVEGVVAVVLGGSFARGDAKPSSDIDLAMYYYPEKPLDIARLRELADELEGFYKLAEETKQLCEARGS